MLALLLAFGTAQADALPVVIRFDSNGTAYASPLVVKLTANGTTTDIVLGDNGERPDFAKGDGRFAGVSQVDATEATLELVAAGNSLGKGTATFQDATLPHDVDVSLTDGKLSIVVSTPPSPNGGAVGGAGGTPPDGGGGQPSAGGSGPGGTPPDGASPPSGGGTPPSGGAATRAPVTFAQSGSSDGLLFIGFGLGLLALLGVVWFWRRSRSGPKSRTAELQVVPEPGLFSPKFPSLSDGLVAWVAEGHAGALLQPLLQTLADRHRVLVVARAEVEVKPLVGGPVYRVVGVRPGLVGDVAEALVQEPGPPLVVLLVLDAADREALRDYRDLLPREAGGIVLLDKDVESSLPRVSVGASDTGWVLTHGEVSVTVGAGPRGLEVREAR